MAGRPTVHRTRGRRRRANDGPDRQGITEVKHVTGYLAFWDELRRRHPDLFIDTAPPAGAVIITYSRLVECG